MKSDKTEKDYGQQAPEDDEYKDDEEVKPLLSTLALAARNSLEISRERFQNSRFAVKFSVRPLSLY